MRVFTVDAKYLGYVESTIAVTLAECGRDIDCRDDEDPRVRKLAPVPSQFIDHAKRGTATIIVGVVDGQSDVKALSDILFTAGAAP